MKVIYGAENAVNYQYMYANINSDEVGKIIQSLTGQGSNCKQSSVTIL